MNNETNQPAITVEDLKKRKQDILDEILSLQARLGEVDYWIRQADPSYDRIRKLAATIAFEPLPIMTPAEESAAKDRAMKAHADELAKGNKALDDAITQVERKNGRAPKNYGLKLAGEYNQRDVRRIWGQTWERKLFAAREEGEIPYRQDGRAFIYEGLDLIGWRAHLEKK